MFIAIDGMGGCGKTTLAQNLASRLHDLGQDVVVTTEPSSGSIGKLARERVDSISGYALACLVAADRFDHLKAEIVPALEAGKTVVTDRYRVSSLVLQRLDGVPLDFLEHLSRPTRDPDFQVLLIGDPKVAFGRIQSRGAHGRFERGLENSVNEHTLYTEWASSAQAYVVDTSCATEVEVTEAVFNRIFAT